LKKLTSLRVGQNPGTTGKSKPLDCSWYALSPSKTSWMFSARQGSKSFFVMVSVPLLFSCAFMALKPPTVYEVCVLCHDMMVGLPLSFPCFLASSVALASSSSCLLTYIDVNEFRCVQKFGDRWGLVTRTATRSTRTTLIVACIFGFAAPACIRETHHLVYIDGTACFIYIYNIYVCQYSGVREYR
jgi:hypothetical protein